jgi:hypothetical protein
VTVLAVLAVLAGCGTASTTTVVVRGADDVQVMTPAEVADQRMPILTTVPDTATADPADTPPGSAAPSTEDDGAGPASSAPETVPQNVDDRPPEIKLFDAFAKFRGCLEDRGYGIEGDLTDPSNPAYQDSDYLDAVSTCAARTDIVAILEEVQTTRSNLTPEEVEQRNEVFIALRDCLRDRGWTVETSTSAIGLLEPTVFQNADGVLDERDINQCLSEQNLDG